MNNLLFIDTETTGFKKSGGLIQEGQGRVCQIALILASEEGKVLGQFSSLIKPDGWAISSGAQAIHGISDIDCIMNGVDQSVMIDIFGKFGSKARKFVAHNEKFDRGMMEVEFAYYGDTKPFSPWFCTMLANTHISKGGKWPKLAAAYKHYTGKDLENAHDAMVDVRACMEIYFAMRGIKL